MRGGNRSFGTTSSKRLAIFPPPSHVPEGGAWAKDTTNPVSAVGSTATYARYTTTISGAKYGNGKYVTWSNSVYGYGGSDEWPPSGAFDNAPGESSSKTGFSSAVTYTAGVDRSPPVSLYITLPSAIVLDSYAFKARSDGAQHQTPTKWSLYGSNDGGSTWTAVQTAQTTANTWAAAEQRTFAVRPTPTAYSSFRWDLVQNDGGYITLGELRIYSYVDVSASAPLAFPPPAHVAAGQFWTKDLNDTVTAGDGSKQLAKCKTTISGAAHGNGQYVAWSDYVYNYTAAATYGKNEGPPSGAFDAFACYGAYGTGFSSGGGHGTSSTSDTATPANLYITLPLRIRMSSYAIQARLDSTVASNQSPTKWNVYGSLDGGATWTQLDAGVTSSAAWSVAEQREFAVDFLGEYSSYRWEFLRNSSTTVGLGISISELRIFGTERKGALVRLPYVLNDATPSSAGWRSVGSTFGTDGGSNLFTATSAPLRIGSASSGDGTSSSTVARFRDMIMLDAPFSSNVSLAERSRTLVAYAFDAPRSGPGVTEADLQPLELPAFTSATGVVSDSSSIWTIDPKLSGGWTASASSTRSSTFEAYKALDGVLNDASDCWQSDGLILTRAAPQWLAISLPAAVCVTEYALTARAQAAAGDPVLYPRVWRLQGRTADMASGAWLDLEDEDRVEASGWSGGETKRFAAGVNPSRLAASELRLLITDSRTVNESSTANAGVALGGWGVRVALCDAPFAASPPQAAAFAFRKLFERYVGPQARVRMSAPSSPHFTYADLTLDEDGAPLLLSVLDDVDAATGQARGARAFSTAAGIRSRLDVSSGTTRVHVWYDQTGYGRHLSLPSLTDELPYLALDSDGQTYKIAFHGAQALATDPFVLEKSKNKPFSVRFVGAAVTDGSTTQHVFDAASAVDASPPSDVPSLRFDASAGAYVLEPGASSDSIAVPSSKYGGTEPTESTTTTLVFDADQAAIYADGQLIQSAKAPASTAAAATGLTLGRSATSTSSGYFRGELRELRLFAASVPPSAVAAVRGTTVPADAKGGDSIIAIDPASGALDAAPLPAAPIVALSLRRLYAAYAGPQVRVRRGADGAVADLFFDATGTLIDAKDATSGAALDRTTFVPDAATTLYATVWYDQSGHGRDFSQTTAARQPQVRLYGGRWEVNAFGSAAIGAPKSFTTPDFTGMQLQVFSARSDSPTQWNGYAGALNGGLTQARHFLFDAGTAGVHYATNGSQPAFAYADGATVAPADKSFSIAQVQNQTVVRIDRYTTWTIASSDSSGTLSAKLQNYVVNTINDDTDPAQDYSGHIAFREILGFDTTFANDRSKLSTIESAVSLENRSAGGTLDVLPLPSDARAAYGFRRLFGVHAGPVASVLRQSDSATADVYADARGHIVAVERPDGSRVEATAAEPDALRVWAASSAVTLQKWTNQIGVTSDLASGSALLLSDAGGYHAQFDRDFVGSGFSASLPLPIAGGSWEWLSRLALDHGPHGQTLAPLGFDSHPFFTSVANTSSPRIEYAYVPNDGTTSLTVAGPPVHTFGYGAPFTLGFSYDAGSSNQTTFVDGVANAAFAASYPPSRIDSVQMPFGSGGASASATRLSTKLYDALLFPTNLNASTRTALGRILRSAIARPGPSAPPIPYSTYLADGLTMKTYAGYYSGNVNYARDNGYSAIALVTDMSSQSAATAGHFSASSTNFTAQWYGYFRADATGTWSFQIYTDNIGLLWFGDRALGDVRSAADAQTDTNVQTASFSVHLESGNYYPLRILQGNATGAASIQLQWTAPGAAASTSNGSGYLYSPLGATSAFPAEDARTIKALRPSAPDGLYWISMAGVPAPTYCVMDSAYDGGGWMLLLKSTKGSNTFHFNASYWTDGTTRLNESDVSRADADAKYQAFNAAYVKDVLAFWPDIQAGGSIGGLGGWTWLVNGYKDGSTGKEPVLVGVGGPSRDSPVAPDPHNFSGFSTSVWSTETGSYRHVFGGGAHISASVSVKWGFIWNNETTDFTSVDAIGGIGLQMNSQPAIAYACGDHGFSGNGTIGINRSARVELFGR